MLELRAVDGAPVLFVDDHPAAASLDQLLTALPELVGEASGDEVRWLGKVAVVLASSMRQWPSRYSISKHIDSLIPSFNRDLTLAFFEGQNEAFDRIRRIDAPGKAAGDLAAEIAEWVADAAPGSSA